MFVYFFSPSYFRQEGQGTVEEVRSRDFRRELEDRERSVREKRDLSAVSGGCAVKVGGGGGEENNNLPAVKSILQHALF